MRPDQHLLLLAVRAVLPESRLSTTDLQTAELVHLIGSAHVSACYRLRDELHEALLHVSAPSVVLQRWLMHPFFGEYVVKLSLDSHSTYEQGGAELQAYERWLGGIWQPVVQMLRPDLVEHWATKD